MKDNQYLKLISLATHALFTGGCIVILFVLVPFWQQSPAEDFLSWFSTYSTNIAMTMLPLEVIPLILSTVICYVAFRQKEDNRKWWLYNLLSNIAILLLFFVYFMPANSSMSLGTITIEQVANEIAKWEKYHIARTALTALSIMFCFIGLKSNH